MERKALMQQYLLIRLSGNDDPFRQQPRVFQGRRPDVRHNSLTVKFTGARNGQLVCYSR